MNENEVQDVLRRRLDLTGDTFNKSMLDTWHAELVDTDHGAAVVAMRRAAAKHSHVRWFDFKAELDIHLEKRRDTHTEREPIDCVMCGGTGWKPADPDRRGNTSVERCTNHMRPSAHTPTPNEGATAYTTAHAERTARRHALGLPPDTPAEVLWAAQRLAASLPPTMHDAVRDRTAVAVWLQDNPDRRPA